MRLQTADIYKMSNIKWKCEIASRGGEAARGKEITKKNPTKSDLVTSTSSNLPDISQRRQVSLERQKERENEIGDGNLRQSEKR